MFGLKCSVTIPRDEGRPVTLANRITLARLISVPVFAALIMVYSPEREWARLAALGLYVAAAISDGLDGFVARAYNQKTRLGAVLDPLADKLMINIGFVFLAVNQEFETPVPGWFPVIILGRDSIIVLWSYLVNEFFGPVRIRPRFLGKVTTVFQMASLVFVLLEVDFAYGLLMVTLGVSLVSFVDYMYVGIRQIGNEDRA